MQGALSSGWVLSPHGFPPIPCGVWGTVMRSPEDTLPPPTCGPSHAPPPHVLLTQTGSTDQKTPLPWLLRTDRGPGAMWEPEQRPRPTVMPGWWKRLAAVKGLGSSQSQQRSLGRCRQVPVCAGAVSAVLSPSPEVGGPGSGACRVAGEAPGSRWPPCPHVLTGRLCAQVESACWPCTTAASFWKDFTL